MTPLYRRIYNRSGAAIRIAMIVLGDLWAALTIGTRFDR